MLKERVFQGLGERFVVRVLFEGQGLVGKTVKGVLRLKEVMGAASDYWDEIGEGQPTEVEPNRLEAFIVFNTN